MTHQKGHGMAVCMVVCQEGRTGRALKLCQLHQGLMVPTQQTAKAAPSSAHSLANAGSQAQLRREPTAAQVPGCTVCPALTPGWDGSSERTGGRCTRVKQLLHLVTEFQEEVSRLRSIRECERETDYWNAPTSSEGGGRCHC